MSLEILYGPREKSRLNALEKSSETGKFIYILPLDTCAKPSKRLSPEANRHPP